MAEQVFKSPGVTTREIDLSGPGTVSPQGIPAGVIGTAQKGPAFVPVTFATYKDFVTKFGGTDGKLFGPMAVSEWMRNARAGTYLRVLGIGDGKQRNTDGTVTNAGFTVGGQQIQANGNTGVNPYATATVSSEVQAAANAVTTDAKPTLTIAGVDGTKLKTGDGGVISAGTSASGGGLYITMPNNNLLDDMIIRITFPTGFTDSAGTQLATHDITLRKEADISGNTVTGAKVELSIQDGRGGNLTVEQVANLIVQAIKRDSSFDPATNGKTSNNSYAATIKYGSDWKISASTGGGDLDSVLVAQVLTDSANRGVKIQFRGSQSMSGYWGNPGRWGGAVQDTTSRLSVIDSGANQADKLAANASGAGATAVQSATAGNATSASTLIVTKPGGAATTITANAAANTVAGFIVGHNATATGTNIKTSVDLISGISASGTSTVTLTSDSGNTYNSGGGTADYGNDAKISFTSLQSGTVATVQGSGYTTAGTDVNFTGGAADSSTLTFTGVPLENSSFSIVFGGVTRVFVLGTDTGQIDISGVTTAAGVAEAVADHLTGATPAENTPTAVTARGHTSATLASAAAAYSDQLVVKWAAGVVTILDDDADSTKTALTLSETDVAGLAAGLGRTYFLSAVMEDKNSSGYMSGSGLTSGDNPILRGVIMVASGCALGLSGWNGSRLDSVSSFAYDDFGASYDAGHQVGCVDLRANGDENFVMFLNGFTNTSKHQAILTASMNPKSPNYFSKVFNTDPTKIEETGHLLYAHYDVPSHICGIAARDIGGTSTADEKFVDVYHRLLLQSGSLARDTMGSSTHYNPNFEGFEDRFKHAISPYVISQTLGTAPKNLFRFHALDAGTAGNTQYKISIANVKKSTDPVSDYGSFDLYIRSYSDSDEELAILEKYTGVDLNPSSERYIARLIGTQNVYFDFDKQTANQKLVIDGLYPNRSQYVRIEVVDDIENAVMEPTALPLGFRGKKHLAIDGTKPLGALDNSSVAGITEANLDDGVREPPVPLRTNVTQGKGSTSKVESRYFWGTQFELQDRADELNKSTVHASIIDNFTKYFPSYGTYPALVGANENTAATAGGTNLDSDLYNYNMFTLERVWAKCKSASTANAVDPREWVEAVYCRSGSAPGAGDMVETNGETHKTAANGYRFLDVSKDFAQQASRRYYKFSFFMQAGFDGLNIYSKDISEMTNPAAHREMANATTLGGAEASTVAAYRKALDIMAEKSDVDVQILAIPGIREPGITDYAIDRTEERFDALYVMDIQECEHAGTLDSNIVTGSVQEISVANTVSKLQDRNLDTSFAAAYFPDVVVVDADTNSNVRTPPSVSVLGALSLNDTVAHPWFAPAGFTRGALSSALESQVKLSRINMDALYEVDINPITSFPTSEGVVVFGQKTLLQAQSSLDRVNVRRLLIDIRRKVKKVANKILFEPNRDTTLARFSAAVQPILTTIQAQQGLDRFKVVIDTTTTTQQDVENNTVRGKIYLQPTRAVEFISLDFVVTNAGTEI